MDPKSVAIPADLTLLALELVDTAAACSSSPPGWMPRGEGATARDLEPTAGLVA